MRLVSNHQKTDYSYHRLRDRGISEGKSTPEYMQTTAQSSYTILNLLVSYGTRICIFECS